jgi:ribosomal protein L21E
MRHAFFLTLAALAFAAPASATQMHASKPGTVTQSGRLVARSAASVTVQRGSRTVKCAVKSSSPKLGDLRAGDKVTIGCINGVLVRVARAAVSRKTASEPIQGATGTICALSASSLTVHNDEHDLTCTLADNSPKLGDYHVGDKVKMYCTSGVLVAIARLDGPAPGDTVQTGLGTLTALSDASVTVHTDSRNLTCTRNAASPKLGDYHVGDKVKIACTNGFLTAIAKVDAPPPVTTYGTGTVSALSTTSITVHNDERDLTCTLTDASPKLGDYHVGDRVKIYCTNGALVAIARADTTTSTTGTLTALSPTSLTVHSDGGDVTCSRTTGSPSLDGYQLGDRVKATCVNGVLTGIARADTYQGGLGTLSALSASSLTVHIDGGDLTCTLGDTSPALGDYHLGDNVKVYCKNGVLYSIARVDTATVTMITTGTLSALSPTSLTVLSDGGQKTCSRTAGSPSLDGYAVGNHVRATCVNGVLTAIEHL